MFKRWFCISLQAYLVSVEWNKSAIRNRQWGVRWMRLPVLWPGRSEVKGWRPTSFAASDWLTPANPFPPSANQSGGWVTSRGNPFLPLKCAAPLLYRRCLCRSQPVRTVLVTKLNKSQENFLLKLKALITTRNFLTHRTLIVDLFHIHITRDALR